MSTGERRRRHKGDGATSRETPAPSDPNATPGTNEPSTSTSTSSAGAPGRRAGGAQSLESNVPCEIVMEGVVDKLKLLNYEREFCRRKKPYWAPLPHTYFALPASNPNEQFFYFTSLVAWLLGLAGRKFTAPGQFDDPNAVCANIMLELKDCGFPLPSFPPAKLKQGCGDPVCGVLDSLIDYVLDRQGFQFKRPIYPADSAEDEEVSEAGGDEDEDVEDEAEGVMYGDDEDEDGDADRRRDGDGHSTTTRAGPPGQDLPGSAPGGGVRVDPDAWCAEVERVAPMLAASSSSSTSTGAAGRSGQDPAGEWRGRLGHVETVNQALALSGPSVASALSDAASHAQSALGRLATRERAINGAGGIGIGGEKKTNVSDNVKDNSSRNSSTRNGNTLQSQWREARERLVKAQARHNVSAENVAELTNELARASEELERIKQTMNERGSNISDTSPVVKMKKAIQTIKDEQKEMEVRIAVAQHRLLQASLVKNDHEKDVSLGSDDDEGLDEY